MPLINICPIIYSLGKSPLLPGVNQPCNLDGDSLTEGGKLSKPENLANQRSVRLMWVET